MQASIEQQMPLLKYYREGCEDFKNLPDHLISPEVINSGYTAFDGLLYFLPTTYQQENLARICRTRGAKKSLRIEGAGESFLATAFFSIGRKRH